MILFIINIWIDVQERMNLANVVLFGDTTGYFFKPYRLNRSYGLYRLATEIRNSGYTCQVIDFLFFFDQDELSKICEKFIDSETTIVGFSSMFWHMRYFTDTKYNFKSKIDIIISYVRTHWPNVKIILGGSETGTILNVFKFDHAFFGYADQLILQFLKTKGTDKTRFYLYHKDRDTFDFVNSYTRYQDNDVMINGSTQLIEISRGCIFKCKFCAYPLNGKKKLDYIKSMDVLRRELIENYERFNITTYIIGDDTFNDSTDKLRMLHELFTTLPFKMRFTCYLRLDLLHAFPEQIPMLKEMGMFGAFFGVESFNHESAKAIGKGMDPKLAKQLIRDLKKHHWGDEINITVSVIVGLPHETNRSLEDFEAYIREDDCVDSWSIFPLGLDKRTKFWRSEFEINYAKYGYTIITDIDWRNDKNEIASRAQAQEWCDRLYKLTYEKRLMPYTSNFFLIHMNNICEFAPNPVSFDRILSMSRDERTAWFEANNDAAITDFINHYKTEILSL